MGAFLCEIPATSGFSASFESSFLEIRIHYPVSLAENSLKKPKKKVPPSKVRRNRRRLMKFLDKPEVQPNSPLLSHEKLGDSEGTPAPPPLVAHPKPCFGKVLSKEIESECDTTPEFHDTAISPSLHREGGEQEKVQGKEVDFDENNDNWSEHGDKILVDNVTGREDEMEEEIETETEMHDSDPIRELYMKMMATMERMDKKMATTADSISANVASMKGETATTADSEPDMANEFETRTEINPTREDAQPVRTVRVPAHQISDRKFVKVERRRRKRKEQSDCKAS